jgi:hypothetical protein
MKCGLRLAALLALSVSAGCRSTSSRASGHIDRYEAALERTAGTTHALGSAVEPQAIRHFSDFYRVYSTESIRSGVRDLYADDAYFGDPFKSVEGIDAIEEYFLKMAEPVKSCTFDITGVDRAEGEYYFRWTMDLVVNRAPKDPIRALGMSHVRFSPEGKVVFQQDYWDSSKLFERLPLVGGLTRWIKKRLD